MANTYLSKTLPIHHGAVYKWTYSFWVKRGTLGANQCMAAARNSGTYSSQIRFTSNDSLEIHDYRTSYKLQKITTRKFRDTSNWYHIVMSNDNSVSSPDLKIYVNGVEETAFDTDNEYSQNETTSFNNIYPNYIGQKGSGADYFDGSISHFHFIDGTAYDADTFGSLDSVTGEWKIKTDVSVTYGTNGFFLLKDDNAVTDQSGNSNNFTLGGGTLTKTEDCPSNVFPTFNYLAKHGTTTSNQYDFLKNANTTFYTPSNNNARKGLFLTSLGATSGKYYCEYKQGGGGRLITGICNANIFNATNEPYVNSNQSALLYLEVNSEIKYDGANYSTGIQSGTSGDIFGFALDLDNKHWYIHKNGTYFKSGDPTSGSTGTGSIIAATSTSAYFNHGEMFFCAGDFSTSGYATSEWNFGNGYFGTTAVSSAGTNASNLGIFEYDVPTGYTALCTKGLNE